MIKESVSIKGSLNIVVKDENNNVKEDIKIKNLVVAGGKDYISQRMTSNLTPVMSHIAIGSGNVIPTVSDTALDTEAARVVFDGPASVTNNTITYVATFPAGTGTGTVAEAGIFNDASAGTLLCRTNFNEVNKANADIIVITWNVTVE